MRCWIPSLETNLYSKIYAVLNCLGSLTVHCFHLWPKVRNFHKMMPDVATLKNAYRDRPPRSNAGVEEDPMKIPQSFTFMRREGLSF